MPWHAIRERKEYKTQNTMQFLLFTCVFTPRKQSNLEFVVVGFGWIWMRRTDQARPGHDYKENKPKRDSLLYRHKTQPNHNNHHCHYPYQDENAAVGVFYFENNNNHEDEDRGES